MSPSYITKLLRTRFSRLSTFGFLFFVVFALILFLSTQNVYSADVTLAWDANSEEDLAGYRVFCRAEGENYNYNDPDWEWDKTETSCTIYNLDDHTTYYFVVRAFDTSGNESGDSNEVCYQPSLNAVPTADAGPDQTVDEGTVITLDGSNSTDPDGSIASYLWTQTEGTSVTLSDAGEVQTTFTAPSVGGGGEVLTFQLEVTDDGGLKDTDTVIINVSNANQAPTVTGLSISGVSSLNENATSNYTATATFSDGTTETVTESVTWTENSSFATINGSGVLSTSEVTWNETVTITAGYTLDGVTRTAQKVVTIVNVPDSNLAPLKAVITSPYNSQMEFELLADITSEPFSDPDGDLHSQSRWQISKKEDFSSLILDVTSTEHLTRLPVPHTVLEAETTYYVRVRFYDVYLETSAWSDAVEFTTTSTVIDVDGNGIPDDQEVAYDLDLNGDGIYDNEQLEDIKCVQSAVGNATIAVSKTSDSVSSIEAIETIDPSTISDKTKRPQKFLLGLFSYRLRVHEPGATATVRIYFSEDISKARTFYKYDTIGGWQDYSQYTTFNDDGRSVTLEVKDGAYGDSDRVANGVIVDPGGLATPSSVGGGSIGGGCFIATAAFGSYVEPHVKLLRDFRDQCLLMNMPGRWFVGMYYRYGPFWSDVINVHSWCKPIVRLALMPLVGISYLLVKASVVTRVLAGLLLAGLLLCCFLRMHGRSVTDCHGS